MIHLRTRSSWFAPKRGGGSLDFCQRRFRRIFLKALFFKEMFPGIPLPPTPVQCRLIKNNMVGSRTILYASRIMNEDEVVSIRNTKKYFLDAEQRNDLAFISAYFSLRLVTI